VGDSPDARLKYYRPEVDGLRAIAVVAVMLYHAGFLPTGIGAVTGGFLGVDVFFVISGYLIASIILRDLERDRFSFLDFYDRRARRILPPLFTVMATSLPFAWSMMHPHALREYAASALAALGFGSNFWFWIEDSYAAEPSQLKPLLHTWSLGVEEQFYLIFPVLLLLTWRFARRASVYISLALTVVSLGVAQYASMASPDAAFYLLPYRGWELLLGAVLAMLELTRGRHPQRVMVRVMPPIGLGLLIWSFVYWDHGMRHPSILTAVPVTGTMLLIWFTRKGELVTRILSSGLMVGVGLISYSLYLWHFPMLSLARVHVGILGTSDKLALLAASVALSVISYFLIERPIRDRKKTSGRVIVLLLAIASPALITAFAVGYASSSQQIESFSFDAKSFDIPIEKRNRVEYSRKACRLISATSCPDAAESGPNLLFVGDSTVPDAINILAPVFPDHNLLVSALVGCPPTPDIRERVGNARHPQLPSCAWLNEFRFNPDSLENIDIVVISVIYDWFRPEHLRPYLDFLRQSPVRKVVLMGNYIRLTEHFPYLAQKAEVGEYISDDLVALDGFVVAAFEGEQELADLADEYGATFVSLKELACDSGYCLMFADGYPFTWDRQHLSREFAGRLSGEISSSIPWR